MYVCFFLEVRALSRRVSDDKRSSKLQLNLSGTGAGLLYIYFIIKGQHTACVWGVQENF